jgi:hypothetical protein
LWILKIQNVVIYFKKLGSASVSGAVGCASQPTVACENLENVMRSGSLVFGARARRTAPEAGALPRFSTETEMS